MSAYNLPFRHTIGDFINAVLAIDNEADAKEFYKGRVAHVQRQIKLRIWKSHCNSEEAARSDIGWCFGEGMKPERIAMWVKSIGASHPVFGSELPSPEQAMDQERD